MFYSFPNPTHYYCRRMEIICERKGVSGLGLDPWKSDLVGLYENSHVKFIEIDRGSTSKWNTFRNFLKNFIEDALSWNKEDDFDLPCVEEVIKNKQGGLILLLS